MTTKTTERTGSSQPAGHALALARRRLRPLASQQPDEYLNGGLLDQPAAALATPALVLDLDRFEHNLKHMADHCQRVGIGLRPHSKTHKCVEIAKRQLALGAVGVCCAKLGEAEAMIAGGVGRVLITAPLASTQAMTRAVRAAAAADDLILVVDRADVAQRLNAIAATENVAVSVLLDLDPGLHRTGIEPGPAALALAQQLVAASHLRFRGLQMYAGHLMHIASFAERRSRCERVLASLRAFTRELAAVGIDCEIVSGGGTGSFDIDPDGGVFTELQAGSYAFMDRQYNSIEPCRGSTPPFFTALFVQTQVVSSNRPGLATTDAGLKAFATDDEAPPIHEGGPQGAAYFFFGDEQGGLRWDHDDRIEPGAWLRAVTPHCDPTVNLYDELHVVRGERLVDIWPIDARGRGA
ncbi:MAG: DSD1 family PLP-dependent enzyme [Pseudomonadota bacterium]